MHGRVLQTILHTQRNHLDLWGYFNIYKKCINLFFLPSHSKSAVESVLGQILCVHWRMAKELVVRGLSWQLDSDTQAACFPKPSVPILGLWSHMADRPVGAVMLEVLVLKF